MKFNQKVFLMSFVLVTIAIYIIGYFMIQNNHKSSIDAQIQENVAQMNRIYDEIQLNGQVVITDIGNRYKKEDIRLEISQGDMILYTNIVELPEEIKNKVRPTEAKACSYIENHILYVCSQRQNYTILMRVDINSIFETRENQITFFIRISMACTLLISVMLYLGVSFITRKIKALEKAANAILKGDYATKVENLGKDEFGTFGKTFNQMTDSIHQNIMDITKVAEDRKNFIGNLTHEIRTPLTSIIGYSSLLQSGKIEDKQILLDYAKRIHEEGIYMKEMSDRLMNLLLIENGKTHLEKVNLSETLTNILQELRYTFPQIYIQGKIEKGIWILSDEVLLKSLIQNLVKNAIQSYKDIGESEKRPVVVWIWLAEDATIQIIDQGKGIPQTEIEKIREPFYTLKKDRNREFSGMGLGLSLCLKIVEAHQGTLSIESEVGEGTCVTLDLGERIYEDKN
ncbi:MAG: ATP-binding protein [Clostridia bacterium]